MGLPLEDKAALKAASQLPPGVPNPAYQNPAAMTPPQAAKPAALVQALQGAGQTGGAQQTDEAAMQDRIKATYDMLTKLRAEMNILQQRRGNLKPGESITDIGTAMANGQKAIADAEAQLKAQTDALVALQKKNAPSVYNPENDSFARHYQAQGDAMKRGATPAMLPGGAAKPSVPGTPPKVKDVIAKMKDDPNFWDYLQAAAAGWGGQKSAYMQRKDKAEENKTEMDRLIKATELQSAAQSAADAAQTARSMKLLDKEAEIRAREKLGVAALPGVSAAGQAYANTFGVKP
jgi:hypothetical protein